MTDPLKSFSSPLRSFSRSSSSAGSDIGSVRFFDELDAFEDISDLSPSFFAGEIGLYNSNIDSRHHGSVESTSVHTPASFHLKTMILIHTVRLELGRVGVCKYQIHYLAQPN